MQRSKQPWPLRGRVSISRRRELPKSWRLVSAATSQPAPSLELHLSPESIDDIFAIAAHIDEDSVEASIRVSKVLVEACGMVALYPQLGKLRKARPNREVRVRLAHPRWPYLIVYEASAKPIRILRVLHGARNLERILKNL